jgi:acyl-CoA thioesterase FadM
MRRSPSRRAAKPGEEVIGESRIIHKGRQSMVCELTVTAGDGRILARGQSTALPVGRGTHKGAAPPDVRKEAPPTAE